MRDIQKQVEQGQMIIESHTKEDMRLDELQHLFGKVNNSDPCYGVCEAIQEAFLMGVAAGARSAQKG